MEGRRRVIWLGAAALLVFVGAAALLATPASAFATPGGGNNYTMGTIDAATIEIDPMAGACHYRIQQTIRISAGDRLLIDAGCVVEFENNRNLTVIGQLIVAGNLSAPVSFTAANPTPVEGQWGGVVFLGASPDASSVDNLTMRFSTYGLRCLACQNLSVNSLDVALNSLDAVFAGGNARNLTLWDISVAITTYASQSAIGISGASNITGGRVSASGTLSVFTLWNVSNASFEGPSSGTGIRRFAAWLDNATNLSIAGLSARGCPAGVLLTRSSNVTLSDLTLSTTSAPLLEGTQVNRLTLARLSGNASSGSAVLFDHLTNSTLNGLSVNGTRFVIALSDSRAVEVANATAGSDGAAFSANRSAGLWVNDSTFQGASPATVNVNASTSVFLRNVTATGTATGFLVVGGSGVWINESAAYGNLGEGARFLNSRASGLARSQLAGNTGAGLALVNASDFVVDGSNVSLNTGVGLFASASTISAFSSTFSGNGKDGLVLTNATRLDGRGLVVGSNAGEGLWLRGGSANLSGAAVRFNALNGTLAEGASLNLTDGTFEGNGRYGVFFSANSTGGWSVVTGALVAHNPAVLAGGVRVAGALFTILNSTVDLRDAPGVPFSLNVTSSGTLWLEAATLRGIGASVNYGILLATGSLLQGLASRIESPGRGGFGSLLGSSCQVDLAGVQVVDAFAPFVLAGCSVHLVDVTFNASRGDVLSLSAGSSLDALRMTIDSPAGSGVLLNGSSAVVRSSSLLNIGVDAITGQGADINLTDVRIVGAGNRGIVLSGGRLTARNLSVNAGGDALAAVQGTTLLVEDSTMTGGLWGVNLGSAVDFDFLNSVAKGATGGLLATAAGNGSLVRSTLSGVAGPALRVDGATSLAGSSLELTGWDSALWLNGVPTISLIGFNLTTTAGVPRAAAWIANTSSLSLEGAVLVGAGPGVGLLLENSSNAALRALNLTGSAWDTGVALRNLAGVTLEGAQVRASVSALAAANVTDLTASNLSLTVLGGGVSLWGSALLQASFSGLAASGGATGVWLEASSSVAVSNASFWNFTSAGLWATSTFPLALVDLATTSGAYGVSLLGCPGARLERLSITGTTAAGVSANTSDGLVAVGVTVRPASGAGFDISSSSGATLDGVRIEGGSDAVRLTASPGLTAADLIVEGSATGIAAYSGSSATLTGARLLNLTQAGVAASDGSSVDLWNGTIGGAPSPPFLAVNSSRGSTVRLFDTLADNATLRSDPAGQVQVWWTLRILVLRGAAPMALANVTLTDRAGGVTAVLVTDLLGRTAPGYFEESRDSNGTRTMRSPYRAQAGLGSFGGATTFDHWHPQEVTVLVGDTSPPNLDPRPDERTRRGDVVVFQRTNGDNDEVGITLMEWSFANETGALQTLIGNPANSFRATYVFAEPGTYQVTVRAFDAAGNIGSSGPYHVRVNYPPFFRNLPTLNELIALVGVPFSPLFEASDNDTDDIAYLVFSIDGPAQSSMTGSQLYWIPTATGSVPFTVSVWDGRDYTRWPFDLLVGAQQNDPRNRPPVFESPAVDFADTRHDYVYEILVSDPDGDPVELQLVQGPLGMTLTYAGGSLRGTLVWSPVLYFPDLTKEWKLNFSIVLRVFDFRTFTYQNFTLHLQNPPDIEPSIRGIPDLRLGPGDQLTFDLVDFATDNDDPISKLRWSIASPNGTGGAVLGFEASNPSKLVIRAPDNIEGTHIYYVTITVKDPAGKSNTTTVRVVLQGPTLLETALPWLILLGIVAAAGGAYALITRQRASALIEEGGTRPASTPATTSAVPPASNAPFPVYLEGALLFDRSDNLIASKAVEGAKLEEVFVLIPAQVRGMLPSPGALAVASVEGYKVALYQQGDVFLAAVGRFDGDPSPWLLDPMKDTLAHVQARAEELKLESLDTLSQDALVAQALAAFLALTAGSSAEAVANYEAQASLRVASVVEQLGGLVRLKVALDNNSGQIAADCRLSLEFDDKALRLERMEPAFEMRRDRIHIGNLRPGERKTVAFYFDPQICSRSFLNATAGWDDASGQFHSASMRTRTAEVVCPPFSTPQGANTAMLRRLLQEELAFRDSKYFRMAAAASPHQVFEACKAAVLAQGVRLVKQFEVERPYRAEAWFYGETLVKGSPMVIWTTVFGQEKVAQFSVASNAQATITGLLAELGRRLQEAQPGGKAGPALQAMGKTQGQGEVGSRASLLSKSGESEAKPKDE